MNQLLIDIGVVRGRGIKASIRDGGMVDFHKSHAVRACFGKAARAAFYFFVQSSSGFCHLTPGRARSLCGLLGALHHVWCLGGLFAIVNELEN